MRRRSGPLRRYGPALMLLSALTWLFVHETLPAQRERRAMAALLHHEQAQLLQVREAVRLDELWLRGLQEDPLLRERFLDAQARSPAAPGPVEVVAPAPEPVPEGEAQGAPVGGRG